MRIEKIKETAEKLVKKSSRPDYWRGLVEGISLAERNDLISTTEAAKLLGVSRSRVRQLIGDGRLAAIRRSPRVVLIRRQEVLAIK